MSRNEKRSTTYKCSTYKEGLKNTFEVTVETDEAGVQPLEFCQSCYCVMKRKDGAMGKGVPFKHSTEVFQWNAHTEDGCTVK